VASVTERIEQFNQGRLPAAVALKMAAMRGDIFRFFRGTAHLFFEDWPTGSDLEKAPASWCCGDLHLENFGSYKGDNRLVYFDINDFDDSVLDPCTRDVARFVTSVLVASESLGVNRIEGLTLAQCFLETYAATLATGHARTVETETAKGLVRDFLLSLKTRRRKDFLNSRTIKKKSGRRLAIDGKKYVEIGPEIRESLKKVMDEVGHREQDESFFEMKDAAFRVAGTGSLGLERYVILVEGNGSPDENYLLDLKLVVPPAMRQTLQIAQPQWNSEADRVRSIQMRMQGTPQALLRSIDMNGKPFLLHELQPSQDKMDLDSWDGKLRRLEKVMHTMARVTAWDQLRSSGRQGSAIADDLIAFGENFPAKLILEFAQDYAAKMQKYFSEFQASPVSAAPS